MAFAPSHAMRWQATRVIAKQKTSPHRAFIRATAATSEKAAGHPAVPARRDAKTPASESPESTKEERDIMRQMAENIKHGEKKSLWQSWRSLSFGQKIGIAAVIAAVGGAGLFISEYLELMYPTDGEADRDSAIAVPRSQPGRLIGITVLDRPQDAKAVAGPAGATA